MKITNFPHVITEFLGTFTDLDKTYLDVPRFQNYRMT